MERGLPILHESLFLKYVGKTGYGLSHQQHLTKPVHLRAWHHGRKNHSPELLPAAFGLVFCGCCSRGPFDSGWLQIVSVSTEIPDTNAGCTWPNGLFSAGLAQLSEYQKYGGRVEPDEPQPDAVGNHCPGNGDAF